MPTAGGSSTNFLGSSDGIKKPWGVAVTPDTVFFTYDLNQVQARARDGGAITTLYDGGQNAQCLSVDDGFLYWPTFTDGKIHRVRIDGTEHVILADGQSHPTAVALAPGALYWNSGNKIVRLAR